MIISADNKEIFGDYDDYDNTFGWNLALAPAIWVSITALLILFALIAVGYLKTSDEKIWLQEIQNTLGVENELIEWRGATAFSGVTFAVTMTLSIAILFWTVVAFWGKAPKYQLYSSIGVVCFFIVVFLCGYLLDRQPFTSELGNLLLYPGCSKEFTIAKLCVPTIMLALACLIPLILTAGACFLLQPMKSWKNTSTIKWQLKILAARLKQLDQMLYIGALALVFGTLQLSAAMAVPLASWPQANEIKTKSDLCKTFMININSDLFFPFDEAQSHDVKSKVSKICKQLPIDFFRSELRDGLSSLIRGITLSFGLAFSALLVALYTPALIGLRLMIEPRQLELSKSNSNQDKMTEPTFGEFDPFHRIATAVATLSPLIAGLLANTFSSV